jgi:hypothetical protein
VTPPCIVDVRDLLIEVIQVFIISSEDDFRGTLLDEMEGLHTH